MAAARSRGRQLDLKSQGTRGLDCGWGLANKRATAIQVALCSTAATIICKGEQSNGNSPLLALERARCAHLARSIHGSHI